MSTSNNKFTIHLVDGTYELFRHYHGAPSKIHKGQEVGAVRSVLRSLTNLLFNPPIDTGPATHIGIATDQDTKTFRHELYEGYKDGRDTPADIIPQFPLLEEGIELAGFKLWGATTYEADDALASAAHQFGQLDEVQLVLIHTADKDLGQCITPNNKITQYNRREEKHYLYKDIIDKFGVPPESIPDYLALMGDSSDNIPGLRGFGAKASSTLLRKYHHIEDIPQAVGVWDVALRGTDKLAETFCSHYEDALLYKKLTTLVTDMKEIGKLSGLQWEGPQPGFEEFCERIAASNIYEKFKNSNL